MLGNTEEAVIYSAQSSRRGYTKLASVTEWDSKCKGRFFTIVVLDPTLHLSQLEG